MPFFNIALKDLPETNFLCLPARKTSAFRGFRTVIHLSPSSSIMFPEILLLDNLMDLYSIALE